MSEQLLTMDDVTKKLSISRQTVHKWIKDGKIKVVRIGRILRFEAAEVNNLIESSRVTEASPQS
jgi:excisionase family DNA binding protein